MLVIPWPLAISVSWVNYSPHLCFNCFPISPLFHPSSPQRNGGSTHCLMRPWWNGFCVWCTWHSIKEMGYQFRSHHREATETGKFCCREVTKLVVAVKSSQGEAWLHGNKLWTFLWATCSEDGEAAGCADPEERKLLVLWQTSVRQGPV